MVWTQRFLGSVAECEDVRMNYALNPLDLLQEISVKGGIASNYFLTAELLL